MKIYNAQVANIDTKDYPDFVDSFLEYAEHADGTPLTDDELDEVNSKHFYLVQELALIEAVGG